MFEVTVFIAVSILVWFSWRLYQAKQYTKFIAWLNEDIKPKLLAVITEELTANRDEVFANNDAHIKATLYYYQQYSVRIFEAAVAREIISPSWFDNKQHKRHASHLLFVQAPFRLLKKTSE